MTTKGKAGPSAQTHHVAIDLASLLAPIDGLTVDPHNARSHAQSDIDAIAASYAAHGQQKPIVALADGTVIAGNGQLLAARSLGWTHVAVVRFLDETKARTFALADNRTAELSTWDDAALALQLQDIAEAGLLADTAFTVDDMMRLGASADNGYIGPERDKDAAPGSEKYRQPAAESFSVQIFFDSSDVHERFMTKVRALSTAMGLSSVTDVVVAVIDEAAERKS